MGNKVHPVIAWRRAVRSIGVAACSERIRPTGDHDPAGVTVICTQNTVLTGLDRGRDDAKSI